MKTFFNVRSIQAAAASVSRRGSLRAGVVRASIVTLPLVLIVLYAFIPILDNGFVPVWDDDTNFLANPYFRGLGAAQVRWAWSTFRLGVYQPLAWLLFEAQYLLFQLDPRGYHLTSLLLQVTNTIVLYVLTLALLARCRTDSRLESPWAYSLSAGMATALFAVHPLRVEPVAWVSGQMYLPCILFSMLTVLAYLRAFWTASSPRWGWLAGSLLLFVAALLFHPVPVTLPVVLLILDAYPLRRFPDEGGRWFGASSLSALGEKVPFVMMSLLFTGLAIAARARSPFGLEPYDALKGVAQACYAIWFYIQKTAFPVDLTAVYSLPGEPNCLAFPYSLCVLATLIVSVVFFILRRRWPGLLAAWLSYLVILAPNSGFIWVSGQVTADRYSYMSMLGCVSLAAAGCCRLWTMPSQRHLDAVTGSIAIGLAALVGLTALTRTQCRTWLNSESLWAHALTHGTDSSYMLQNDFANVLYNQGKFEAAEAHYREALRLNPEQSDAHYNLAMILFRDKRYTEAEAHFTEVLRRDPENAQAHYNLGRVFAQVGNYESAKAQFAEAIRLQPGDPNAYNASAMIVAACPDAKFRDGKRAVQLATRACEITEWKNPTILDTFAAAQAEAGYYGTAVKWQERAIGLLTDERQKNDYRSRLAIYQARKPYRQLSRKLAPIEARP